MRGKRKGLPVGMWILGGSSGHVANPAPTCAKCGMAEWTHILGTVPCEPGQEGITDGICEKAAALFRASGAAVALLGSSADPKCSDCGARLATAWGSPLPRRLRGAGARGS